MEWVSVTDLKIGIIFLLLVGTEMDNVMPRMNVSLINETIEFVSDELEVLRREIAVGTDQANKGDFSPRSVADIAMAVLRERQS